MDKCGVCEKDALEDATDGYGFYRKPGNVQEYALRFVYTSRSNHFRTTTRPKIPMFIYILVSSYKQPTAIKEC